MANQKKHKRAQEPVHKLKAYEFGWLHATANACKLVMEWFAFFFL